MALNLGLNLLLIPRYKALGAAIASVSSQGFYAVGQIILSTVIFRLRPKWRLIIRLFIFAAVMLVAGWQISLHLQSWWQGFFILIVLAIGLTWLLGIVTPKGLYSIVRYDV